MSKFNERLTARSDDFNELKSDVKMVVHEDDNLIESQLQQWVDKLAGLLNDIPNDKKHKLLEKVITKIQTIT